MIVGGTGFYIQALLYDIDFTEQKQDKEYRAGLERTAAQQGSHALYEMLALIDPKAAAEIHENNVKRMIRALEFYHLTGKKISEHNAKERQKESPYNFAYFVLNDERMRLYQRINERVEQMLAQGLEQEVQKLRRLGCSREMVSMQGLGYKELLDYLENRCTLEEAGYRMKRDTRHFAKRQLTWFRREREVIWINKPEFDYDNDKILSYMQKELTQKGILT